MVEQRSHLQILGTRGIPAAHGGFETFAEKLALFMVDRGWRVTVYCQTEAAGSTERFRTEVWRGIERVLVAVERNGPAGTIEFDWHSVRHAMQAQGVCLVLGYNTGLFLLALRLAGKKIITNMDGIEWKRPK